MNIIQQATVTLVTNTFHGFSGPAKFKYSESGWWFEWEGKEIVKELLELHPIDIEYDDVIKPMDGSFFPSWTTDEALLWLLPGMIRVVFEVDPPNGDMLIQEIFSELHKRILENELRLTRLQMEALLEVHEVFYCTEDFDWVPERHWHPLCDIMKRLLLNE